MSSIQKNTARRGLTLIEMVVAILSVACWCQPLPTPLSHVATCSDIPTINRMLQTKG